MASPVVSPDAPRDSAPDPVEAAPEAVDTREREGELVGRAAKGDAQAWARLYQGEFDRLFRDVAFLVGSAPTTEEIVQETFAAALVALRRFDRRASFSTWLRGIAHNLVRRHWRTQARRGRAYHRLEQITPSALGVQRDDPETAAVQQARARALQAVLETVPAALREAFVLCDVQGLAPTEASERLGISVGNVRVRATRARARIRDELVRLGWLEESP